VLYGFRPPCDTAQVDLSDLQVLLQVVEFGSFQRAAVARRVSRNVMRRQVERLEAEVGVPLLQRGARGTALTAAGRELVEGAAGLMASASSLADRARAASDEARGVLRFIVPTGMPSEPRMHALLGLKALHEDLDVELVEAEDPLSRIGEPFDLMLHLGDAPAQEGWFSHVLMQFPLRLRASAGYVEEHGTPTSLDELRQHTLLQWSAPESKERGLPLRSGGVVTTTPWLRTANLTLLLQLADAGTGILYAPVFPSGFGGGGGLVPMLDDIVGGTATLRALSPRPSRVDPRIRAMLENAQHLIAAMSGAADG